MKTPLVLLSGLLSNDILWQHQVRHLDDIASIHIISAAQNTPEKMVEQILAAAPPTFALAGHSMGGWLCLEVMRTAPSRVQKLCLLNTTSRSDSQEKAVSRQKMIQDAKQGHFHEIVDAMLERFVHNTFVKADVKNMFLAVGEKAFIAQEEAMSKRGECLSILPTITCPALVVCAVQDKIFSLEEHQELVSNIPNAELAQIEGSGHMSPMEAPQAITAHLQHWLIG